jgi:hypothetical protein
MSELVETSIAKTVNLLAYAYAGSNPALPTIFILRKLRRKAQLYELGFFLHHCHY